MCTEHTDRSIDRSILSRSFSRVLDKKRETANNGERVSNVDRGWVERAGLCLTTDNSLIQCDRCKVGSTIATVRVPSPQRAAHATLVATFCRERRAVPPATFTHSPTRAPRSSNFHPRCIDRFQEDSSQLHHSALTRIADQVTSKSNLS